MIPQKSLLRKHTPTYFSDNIFDDIDIKGSLEKNKVISRTEEKLFLYVRNNKNSNSKHNKDLEINFNEIFVNEEKKIVPFTDYFCNFSFLGNGAYGTVFSAYDRERHEKVAIKVN